MSKMTPCDTPTEVIRDGRIVLEYRCPFSDEPTSEMCNRTCCGLAVDEDEPDYYNDPDYAN